MKTYVLPSGPLYRFAITFTPAIQDEKYCLTLVTKLSEFFRSLKAKYSYQLEVGAETKKIHFQINIGLTKTKKSTQTVCNEFVKAVDIDGYLHVAPVHDSKSVDIYCQKPERLAGPWTDKDVSNLKPAFDKALPWQQQVIDMISVEPDNRTVNWIYDPVGSQGKSMLGIWLYDNKRGLMLPYAKTADLTALVCKFDSQSTYVFDLTRCKPRDVSQTDLYSAIEGIKAGYIVNTKFEVSIKRQNPSHVWIFSNQMPNKECLSGDRWKIWMIENNILVKKN